MSQEASGGAGISVAGLLGVAFVVLKLCGVIDWPWLWVLSPFWIGLVIGIIIFVVLAIIIWKNL